MGWRGVGGGREGGSSAYLIPFWWCTAHQVRYRRSLSFHIPRRQRCVSWWTVCNTEKHTTASITRMQTDKFSTATTRTRQVGVGGGGSRTKLEHNETASQLFRFRWSMNATRVSGDSVHWKRETETERQTERQTERETDRQTKTDKQRERESSFK